MQTAFRRREQHLRLVCSLLASILVGAGPAFAADLKPGDRVVVQMKDGTEKEGSFKSQDTEELTLEAVPGMA